MPSLRIKTGPNKGKVFEVKDQVITLGRDETQTIQILDQGVSRAHAEIFRLGDACFVRDLNSTNGTYVNNVKVTEEVLKSTDELLIGTTILFFEDGSNEAVAGEDVEENGGTGAEATTLALKTGKTSAKGAAREVTSRNLTVMTEIGKILSSGRDLLASAKRAVEVLSEAVGADHSYLFLVDPATDKLVARVERGEETAEQKVSWTIVRRAMQSGAPVLTTDATLDDRFMLSESIVLKKIKSVIATPIMVREKAEGLLYFHAHRNNAYFKVEDLELVAAVALQLALAMAIQGGVASNP